MRFKQYMNENKSVQDYSHYTDAQLLREAILEEYYASNVYSVMATYAKDNRVKKILKHVSNEEKEHIGEFEHLLEMLDPDHEKNVESGEEEAEEELKGVY